MFKNIAILFFICYPLFVFYTREPDYGDSDFSKGTIHFVADSENSKKIPVAFFTLPHKIYSVKADYLFKHYTEGERVNIIYEAGNPSNASIYSIWGYWLRWKELCAIITLFLALYLAAAAITGNPTPEALIEELEGENPKPRRRKYDD